MNKLSNRPQNRNFGSRIIEITIARNKNKSEALKLEYEINPKLCENCNGSLSYDKRKNSFCSRHCSGMKNNQGRVLTEEHKAKTSEGLKKYHASRPKKKSLYQRNYIQVLNLD